MTFRDVGAVGGIGLLGCRDGRLCRVGLLGNGVTTPWVVGEPARRPMPLCDQDGRTESPREAGALQGTVPVERG